MPYFGVATGNLAVRALGAEIWLLQFLQSVASFDQLIGL